MMSMRQIITFLLPTFRKKSKCSEKEGTGYSVSSISNKTVNMKSENLLPFIFLLLFIHACNKGDKPVPVIPEGAVNLSDLETRNDYYLPFALVNDTDIIHLAILNYDTIDFPSGGFIKFDETGFFQLILKYKDTRQPDDTFLFTTMTAERKNSEWGIR